MKAKMTALYCKAYCDIQYFIHKEKGAVDIVAIVILIAVAIGLAVVFRKQLVSMINKWLGNISDSGDGAITDGVAGNG